MSEYQKKQTGDGREVYLIGAQLRRRVQTERWEYDPPEWLRLPPLNPHEAAAVEMKVRDDSFGWGQGRTSDGVFIQVRMIRETDSMKEGGKHLERVASATTNAFLTDETDVAAWDNPKWYLWRGSIYAAEIRRASDMGIDLAGQILKSGLQVRESPYRDYFLAHAMYEKRANEKRASGKSGFGAAKLIDWFNGLSPQKRAAVTRGEQAEPLDVSTPAKREAMKNRVNDLLKKAGKDRENGKSPNGSDEWDI